MSAAVTLKGNAKIAFENTPQILVMENSLIFPITTLEVDKYELPNEGILDFTKADLNSLFSYHRNNYKNNTAVVLPEGFGRKSKSISSCFWGDSFGWSSLGSISLPEGFGGEAEDISGCFAYCYNIRELNLPAGFGSKATDLDSCFRHCDMLRELNLPDGFGQEALTMNYTFASCEWLKTLKLPENCGRKATSLAGTFYFHKRGVSYLTSIILPAGFGKVATDISFCFFANDVLKTLTLPDGFGAEATNTSNCFFHCNALTTITGTPNFKGKVNFVSSPLDNDSATRIVNGLQTVTETQSIIFSDTTKTNLTEAGLLDGLVETASNKGWTVA